MDKFAVKVTKNKELVGIQFYLLERGEKIRVEETGHKWKNGDAVQVGVYLIEYSEIKSIERTVGEQDMPVNVWRNYMNCSFRSHHFTV